MDHIIIFDTETTGLDKPLTTPLPQQPFIIEFAAVKVTDDDDMEIIDEIEFKCKPPNKLSEDIKKFHKKNEMTGLSDEDLVKEKTFPFYYGELIQFFFATKTMIAHNVGFDRSLLKFELMRMNKVLQFPWPTNHICTIEQTRSIKGDRLKLIDLYKYLFGSELVQKHRAMDDVIQLTKICRELRKRKLL